MEIVGQIEFVVNKELSEEQSGHFAKQEAMVSNLRMNDDFFHFCNQFGRLLYFVFFFYHFYKYYMKLRYFYNYPLKSNGVNCVRILIN